MSVIDGDRPGGRLQIDVEAEEAAEAEWIDDEDEEEQPVEAGAIPQKGSRGNVKKELRRCGLYDTDLVEGSGLIKKYIIHMRDIRVTQDIATQYISAVRKIANYIMRSTGVVEGPLTPAVIVRNGDAIRRYYEAYLRISGNYGTIASQQKAFETFVSFLLSEPGIGMEDSVLHTLGSQLLLRMQQRIAKSQRCHIVQINKTAQKNDIDGFKISMKDIAKIIYNKDILARMQQIMKAGDKLTKSDYVFFVGFLMFYTVTAGAKRPEVVEHDRLTMSEWTCRKDETVTKDGKTYRATSLSLTNTKIKPKIQHVVIKQQFVAMYEHYVDSLRPIYSEDLDKQMGENAAFFVNTAGRYYKRPHNAMTTWIETHKPEGTGQILFTTIRKLTATKNDDQKVSDPEAYAAVAEEMGHTTRTHEAHYSAVNRTKAVVGQMNIDRFYREELSDGDEVEIAEEEEVESDASSTHYMPEPPVTRESIPEPKKQKGNFFTRAKTVADRVFRTGSSSEAPELQKPVKESAADKYNKAFFSRFPLEPNVFPNITAGDVTEFHFEFGKVRRQLMDKYRNAQRELRQDLVAYELFKKEKAEFLVNQQEEQYIKDVEKVRLWQLSSKVVLKRLVKMRGGELSEAAVDRLEYWEYYLAAIPPTQAEIDAVVQVRERTVDEQNKFVAKLCDDRYSSDEKALFDEIVRSKNALGLKADPKIVLHLIIRAHVNRTVPSPTGSVQSDNLRFADTASPDNHMDRKTPSPTENVPADNFSPPNEKTDSPQTPVGPKVPHCRADTKYPVILDHHEHNSFPGLLVVKDLEDRGDGVVTTEDFNKGDTICTYGGTMMTVEQHMAKQDKRSERHGHRVNMYRMVFTDNDKKQQMVVEGHHGNSFGPKINHSQRHPNVEPFQKTFTTANGEKHTLVLFRAKKHIAAGTELFYQYNGYENCSWAKSCWCAKCQGNCHCKVCGGQQKHQPDPPATPRKTPETPSTPPGTSMSHTRRDEKSVGFDAFVKMYSRRGQFTVGKAKGDGLCAAHALAATFNQHGYQADFKTIAGLMSNLDAPLRDEGVLGSWFTYEQVYWFLLTHGMPFVIVDATRNGPPSVVEFATEGAAPERVLGVAIVPTPAGNHWVPIVASDSSYVRGELVERHGNVERHQHSEIDTILADVTTMIAERVNADLDNSPEQRAIEFRAECRGSNKTSVNRLIKKATNTARKDPVLFLKLKKSNIHIVSKDKVLDAVPDAVVDLTTEGEVATKSSKKKSRVSCKEMTETSSSKKHDGDGKDNSRSEPTQPRASRGQHQSHKNVNAAGDRSKETTKRHKTTTSVQFGTITIFEDDGNRAVTTAENIPPDYASVNQILRELHGLRTGRTKEEPSGSKSWYAKKVAAAKEFKRKVVGDYLRAKSIVELKRNSARNVNQLAYGRSYDSLIANERQRRFAPSLPTLETNQETLDLAQGGESGVGSNDEIIWFANQNEQFERDHVAEEEINDVVITVVPSDSDEFPMSNPQTYFDTLPKASYDKPEEVWESLDPQPRPCLRLRAAVRRNEDEQFHRTIMQQPRQRITPAHQFAQMASYYKDAALVERSDKREVKLNAPRVACQDVANLRLQPIVEAIPLEDIELMRSQPDEALPNNDENEKPIVPLMLERFTSSFSITTMDSGFNSD